MRNPTIRAAQKRRSCGLALLTFGLLLPTLTVQAQDGLNAARNQRRLTVTATGEVKVKPDKADITIGVVTENKSSQTAAKENANIAQRIINALKLQGIAERDIQTANYSIEPVTQGGQGGFGGGAVQGSGFGGVGGEGGAPPPHAKNVILGYRVYNQVRVTVHDLNRIGAILDATTVAGANTIEGISFGVDDSKAAETDALEKALKEARRKAEHIARAANVTLLGIYEINEGGYVRPVPMMFGKAAEAGTPISPGEQSIQANVTVVYEISGPLRGAGLPPKSRAANVVVKR